MTLQEIEDSLLPCPFCGGKAIITLPGYDFTYGICCLGCGVHTRNVSRMEDIAGLWNDRVEVDQ